MGSAMFSVQNKFDPSLYIESDTPQSEQRHKGWYWYPPTRKYYRWDNMPDHKGRDNDTLRNELYNQID